MDRCVVGAAAAGCYVSDGPVSLRPGLVEKGRRAAAGVTMLVIGHRGAAGLAPENTLGGIERALSLGVDMVEIDVQAVGGELVVFHDDTLERCTDGQGPLTGLGFAALRRLDAGGGEQVPTLREVLARVAGRADLNVEVKAPGIAAAVTTMLRDTLAQDPRWHGRLLLSSFHVADVPALGAAGEGLWRLGILFEDDADSAFTRAAQLRAWSIHPSLRQVDAALVERAHAAGLRVMVYTVNSPADLLAMQALGVDGVFTDYPDRALASLRGGRRP